MLKNFLTSSAAASGTPGTNLRSPEMIPYKPFGRTKVWPHGDNPLVRVGELEMNRNPDNYFRMVENASCSPANAVPVTDDSSAHSVG